MKHVTKKMLNLATAVAMAMAIGAPTQVFAAELVATKSKELAGRTYTFQKWMDAKGNATAVILDEKGNTVSARDLPPITRNIMQPQLAQLLRTQDSRGRVIKVNVALNIPFTAPTETAQAGTVEISEKGKTQQLWINGRRISEQRYARVQAAEQQTRGKQAAVQVEERRRFLEAFAKRHSIDLPKEALGSLTQTLTLELKAKQIEELAHSGDSSILGIELFEESQDDLSSAMAASGIDPWALDPAFPTTKGDGIGIYQTEEGCANEARFDDYTRLGGNETDHSRNVGGIIKGVAPEAYLYCRSGAVLPNWVDLYALWIPDWLLNLAGISSQVDVPIQVVTRSNGAGGGDNYTATDRDWDDFIYTHMIPTFKSAGNAGNGTGDVTSPGKGLNIVTVGNYDDATNTIAPKSSFVDPTTGNVKPEISAPGTNVTAGDFTNSGTSMATPHAAAFTADSLSSYSWLQYKPHLAKAKQLAGATDEIAGGYNKVGVGGIDFLSSHYDGWNFWWHGNNGGFSSWDAADGVADNYITQQVFIPNTYDGVRIAMTWLTRGTYTFDHKGDAHAIGMDLDLTVYDPSGSYVGSSSSWDNAWEVVDFTPTTAGYYTFKIKRFSNNDTVNNMRVGVAVNFYND